MKLLIGSTNNEAKPDIAWKYNDIGEDPNAWKNGRQ